MKPRNRHIRSGGERLAHWLLAASVLALIFSGLEIYRAAPFFAIQFDGWPTLGVDLTAALLWHFAAAWGLLFACVAMLMRRISGRGIALWPIPMRIGFTHDDQTYNPVQKVAYLGVFALLLGLILSGFVLWKPVQLQSLGWLMGGYEAARRIHFIAMAALAFFMIGHVLMSIAVPRTIAAMLLGFRVTETRDVKD